MRILRYFYIDKQQICGRLTDSEHNDGPGGGREVFFERAVPSARIVDKLNVAG